MLRKARIIGALLLAAALPACGFLQLTYNNAPELISRWLDGYVGFTDAQAPRVRADIERLQHWHRAQALPRYAGLLDRLAQDAGDDLNADTACRVQDEVQTRFSELLVEAEPAIATIALELTAAQWRHLEKKYAKQNAKFREKWIDVTPAGQFDARLERAVANAERVYGRLEAPQHALLREQLAASPFDAARTLAEMRRRQRDTLATLQRVASDTAWTAAQLRETVHGWLERMQRSPDAAQRAHQQTVRQRICVNIAGLHNSTTPAQRAHAAERLGGWARDLRELSRRAS